MKDKIRSERHFYYRGGILAAALLTVMIAGSALGSSFRVDQGSRWNIHLSDKFVGNSVQGKTIRYHLQIDANKADSSRDICGKYTGTLNLYADIEVPKPATGYMQYMYVRAGLLKNCLEHHLSVSPGFPPTPHPHKTGRTSSHPLYDVRKGNENLAHFKTIRKVNTYLLDAAEPTPGEIWG